MTRSIRLTRAYQIGITLHLPKLHNSSSFLLWPTVWCVCCQYCGIRLFSTIVAMFSNVIQFNLNANEDVLESQQQSTIYDSLSKICTRQAIRARRWLQNVQESLLIYGDPEIPGRCPQLPWQAVRAMGIGLRTRNNRSCKEQRR